MLQISKTPPFFKEGFQKIRKKQPCEYTEDKYVQKTKNNNKKKEMMTII